MTEQKLSLQKEIKILYDDSSTTPAGLPNIFDLIKFLLSFRHFSNKMIQNMLRTCTFYIVTFHNIGREYLMPFYLKVSLLVLLSNRMTSGIHAHSILFSDLFYFYFFLIFRLVWLFVPSTHSLTVPHGVYFHLH